jgi:hypothetical protein
MAMEFLSFHNQLIARLSAHDEHDYLITLYIIQHSQVSCT